MLIHALLKVAHLLSVILWLGGIAFLLCFLRPAAASLEPAVRVPLMHGVLRRFLGVATVLAVLTVGSGLWMWMRMARQATQAGASFNSPLEWMVMAALGLLMAAVAGHLRFALLRRLGRAVAAQDWQAGAAALSRIRAWAGLNLALGVVIVLVVVLGAAS